MQIGIVQVFGCFLNEFIELQIIIMALKKIDVLLVEFNVHNNWFFFCDVITHYAQLHNANDEFN